MKKVMICIYIIMLSMALIGCEGNGSSSIDDAYESTEDNVFEYNVEDIQFEWLPEMEYTTERKLINDMKKFVCYFAGESWGEPEIMIGVNIETKKMYVNKGMGGMDGSDSTCNLDDENIEELLNIIEKYKIQDWEYKYILEDCEDIDDGYYAWDIYMQYGDGSIEKHCGEANSFRKSEVQPSNYIEFRTAMVEFTDKFLKGFCGLDLAERTNETKPLDQMKKIVCKFLCDIHDKGEIVAIDIDNKKLYVGYDINEMDSVEPTCALSDSDIEEILNIIEIYKVQEWEQFYKYEEDEESGHYVWDIYMENEDRTVEIHHGFTNKPDGEEVKPSTYDEFKTAIEEFVDKCVSRGL